MSECSRRDCDEPAAREVRWEQPLPPPDGPMRVLGADLCEEHASEIEAKLCERDDCLRCAAVVIALDGHDHATGAPRHDELRVCDQCWEALQAAPSITLNGITMVHDGNLRMKVLPPSIGQG